MVDGWRLEVARLGCALLIEFVGHSMCYSFYRSGLVLTKNLMKETCLPIIVLHEYYKVLIGTVIGFRDTRLL